MAKIVRHSGATTSSCFGPPPPVRKLLSRLAQAAYVRSGARSTAGPHLRIRPGYGPEGFGAFLINSVEELGHAPPGKTPRPLCVKNLA
jgi:hypothetical protein